jgi:hypothetical protein
MVNYTCPNCLKEFNKKDSYIKHTEKKKKPCGLTPHNSTQAPHKSAQNETIVLKEVKDEMSIRETNNLKSHECTYCNAVFTRSDVLKRHIDRYCKTKKEYDDKNSENNILNNRIVMLEKKIEELQMKPQNINNNVVINNNNNSKTLNVGNKSVNIVAHGQEDLSTIDLETKLNFLNTLDFPSIIPNMARHLFINDDKPEFKNFRVTDISRNKSEYHDGNKWMTGRADQGVLKIFENINDVLIEPFTGENLEKTIKFIQKESKKYSKQTITWSKNYCKNLYDTKDKDNVINKNDILDELKLIFYNNREQILNIDKNNTKNNSTNTIETVINTPTITKDNMDSINNKLDKNTNNLISSNQNISEKVTNLNTVTNDSDSDSLSSDDEYIPTLVQPRYYEPKKIGV